MRFMELDEAGHIHHIMDDPTITMLPVVNRFHHGDLDRKPLMNEEGKPISYLGHRVLGSKPTEHPPHLLPQPISDAHYEKIMSWGGLSGIDDPKNGKGHWRVMWDSDFNVPVKKYVDSEPLRQEQKQPCPKCPEKK
jgi:hypothetical protein